MATRLSIITLFLLLSIVGSISAQNPKAYEIYNAQGEAVSFDTILAEAARHEVILFGESHNNPIIHWLQLQIAQRLFAEVQRRLQIGMEMFERDDQLLIDEYFAGYITQKSFEDEARLWNNYATDYKPVLEFAKAHGLAMVATNVPRRYANLVFRAGLQELDSLPQAARNYLPPLPIPFDIELESYQNMMQMMGGHGGGDAENFPKAQAIKDATMAHSILQYRTAESVHLHLNGSFHSDQQEGIGWYLREYEPEVTVLTISTAEQEDPGNLAEENRGRADFIICVPSEMTKTY